MVGGDRADDLRTFAKIIGDSKISLRQIGVGDILFRVVDETTDNTERKLYIESIISKLRVEESQTIRHVARAFKNRRDSVPQLHEYWLKLSLYNPKYKINYFESLVSSARTAIEMKTSFDPTQMCSLIVEEKNSDIKSELIELLINFTKSQNHTTSREIARLNLFINNYALPDMADHLILSAAHTLYKVYGRSVDTTFDIVLKQTLDYSTLPHMKEYIFDSERYPKIIQRIKTTAQRLFEILNVPQEKE